MAKPHIYDTITTIFIFPFSLLSHLNFGLPNQLKSYFRIHSSLIWKNGRSNEKDEIWSDKIENEYEQDWRWQIGSEIEYDVIDA